jgi:hypothetical protein
MASVNFKDNTYSRVVGIIKLYFTLNVRLVFDWNCLRHSKISNFGLYLNGQYFNLIGQYVKKINYQYLNYIVSKLIKRSVFDGQFQNDQSIY